MSKTKVIWRMHSIARKCSEQNQCFAPNILVRLTLNRLNSRPLRVSKVKVWVNLKKCAAFPNKFPSRILALKCSCRFVPEKELILTNPEKGLTEDDCRTAVERAAQMIRGSGSSNWVAVGFHGCQIIIIYSSNRASHSKTTSKNRTVTEWNIFCHLKVWMLIFLASYCVTETLVLQCLGGSSF